MALTKVTLSGAVDTIKAAFTKVNDIIDDLASTSNGLGASTIGIEDSGANMAAANVEDALAEIYTDTTASRSQADGLGEEDDTTTGTTWGYKAGVIRFDNTVTSVAAGTVSLTDDSDNYVEIDSSGNVTANTTAFTTGQIPLRFVTCASGAQTVSTDKRAWLSAPKSASTSQAGIAELATSAEALAGTDTSKPIVPSGLSFMLNIAQVRKRFRFMYAESLDFTSGGTTEIEEGDTITGATGGATGVVEYVSLTSGSWAGGDAAGTFYIHTKTGTFESENIDVGASANLATIGADSDKNAVVIYPGVYTHAGTATRIMWSETKLAYEFTSLGVSDWSYLYFDDSAIVSADTNKLTSSLFTDSTTEPDQDVLNGWENGNDKCIFAVLTDGSSDIIEFFHDGSDYVRRAGHVQVLTDGSANSFTDVDCSSYMPIFSIRAKITGRATSAAAADANLFIRTNGQTDSTGHLLNHGGKQNSVLIQGLNSDEIYTDASQVFEYKLVDVNSTETVAQIYLNGWYLPIDV